MSDKDFIQQAVERARSLSKNPPRLNTPVAKMVSLDQRAVKRAFRELGRESGPDGRPKRRSLNVPSLGDVLRLTVQQQGWEEDLGTGWVIGNWPTLVGPAVAAHTKAIKVEHQVLYVSCDHSSWATNLRYLQAEILKKIAEKIGDGHILELRIQGPKQRKNYHGPLWVRPQGSTDTYG